MSTVAERIAAGVRLLDEKGPAGWRDGIDLKHLDMRSVSFCVLGKLYGHYQRGLQALDLGELYSAGVPYGFQIDLSKYDGDEYADFDAVMAAQEREYQELTKAWKEELAK